LPRSKTIRVWLSFGSQGTSTQAATVPSSRVRSGARSYERGASLATAARPTSPTTSSGTSYVVKKGDTFYQIALRVYKNGSLWPKLYEHNRSRLRNPKDPGSLQADQRILIPMIGS